MKRKIRRGDGDEPAWTRRFKKRSAVPDASTAHANPEKLTVRRNFLEACGFHVGGERVLRAGAENSCGSHLASVGHLFFGPICLRWLRGSNRLVILVLRAFDLGAPAVPAISRTANAGCFALNDGGVGSAKRDADWRDHAILDLHFSLGRVQHGAIREGGLQTVMTWRKLQSQNPVWDWFKLRVNACEGLGLIVEAVDLPPYVPCGISIEINVAFIGLGVRRVAVLGRATRDQQAR